MKNPDNVLKSLIPAVIYEGLETNARVALVEKIVGAFRDKNPELYQTLADMPHLESEWVSTLVDKLREAALLAADNFRGGYNTNISDLQNKSTDSQG